MIIVNDDQFTALLGCSHWMSGGVLSSHHSAGPHAGSLTGSAGSSVRRSFDSSATASSRRSMLQATGHRVGGSGSSLGAVPSTVSATVLMGSPWTGAAPSSSELRSGPLLHLGTGGVWHDARVVLSRTVLEVIQQHESDAPQTWSAVSSRRGSDLGAPASPRGYTRLARVPLHMCLVEPVLQPRGAFVVSAARSDGARVVLRARFGDAHLQGEWMAAVRAARDALPPPSIRTLAPPVGFTGTLQYLGWVRVTDLFEMEMDGVVVGARLVLAVSDHDMRLLRRVPDTATDLNHDCLLRIPLASARLPPLPVGELTDARHGQFTVQCVNGAKLSMLTDGLVKVRYIIEERIDQAIRMIGTMKFRVYHNGTKCIMQFHHNNGVSVVSEEEDSSHDSHKASFSIRFPALETIDCFPESDTLELNFKDGTHKTMRERLQVERLEEVTFFLHNFLQAYVRAHDKVEALV
eukprot:m.16665 g.16665  ORF g.16665 m.16665 type:complete len:463 (+) comp3412_c0_seq1:237-1625(+)